MNDPNEPFKECYFRRQPKSPEEIDRAINAINVSEMAALRYAGTDEAIIARLVALNCADQCDHIRPPARRESRQPPADKPGKAAAKIWLVPIALVAGGWMLFDGIHVLTHGKYFGRPEPGPWSVIIMQLGIDPFALGSMFVALGTLWIVFLAALLRGKRWGWYGSVAIAIVSLWYLPIGTMLSVLYLVRLIVGKKQLIGS